ncbi:phasin family protein [Thalassospira sp. A40-3]|uniref:phasin family protein n=1 Tax=Thalassospira sp. A40-3 TaxID=2785908 RepID=UPI0018CD159C|nr:phasin family protein [Thalassospira sp. A40-3]QPO13123.1 phasin family protein [Thalassospira sp. A40-3]
MADSKKKLAGKTATKQASASSPKTVAASVPSAAQSAPAKRKVMTSSEIEAAAQQPSAEAQKASPSPSPDKAKTPSDGASTKAAGQAASSETVVKVDASASAAKTPVKDAAPAGASEKNAESPKPAKADASSPSAPASKQAESAAKPSVATSGAARPNGDMTPPAIKSTAPKSPTKSEKANTVSTKPKTTATSKSAASAAPKKKTVAKSAPKKAAAAPASTASKSAPAPKAAAPATSEKSAAPATVAAESAVSKPAATPAATQTPAKPAATAKPVDAKPKAEPKQGDVFGFGALFIDGTGMEPYFELWKTPEVEAMVAAGNEAFEESVSAANEAFGKIFETMTGQADVFSGAGSRVAAQYEELLDTQKKSFEEVWQATMAMFEKTGGIGTELSTWMQKEFEASQDDLDELTKVESLADLQELHSRIVNRCYESSLAEGEKMQELMFSAFSDGLNAISKATNVALK